MWFWLALACSPEKVPGNRSPSDADPSLVAARSQLFARPDGSIEIFDEDGEIIVAGGFAAVELDALGDAGLRLQTNDGAPVEIETGVGSDAFGARDELILRRLGEPVLEWVIAAREDAGFYTFELNILNDNVDSDHSGGTVSLAKAVALGVDGQAGGGLYLGADPATHRILENGSYATLDFFVDVLPGDTEQNEGYAALAPGDYQGHSVSNWNHLVADLDSDAAWVAGALSVDASMPVMSISHNPWKAGTSEDGRLGFSALALEAAYLPAPRVVQPGERFAAEAYYVDPNASNGLTGLEDYAAALGTWQGITPWMQRDGDLADGGRPVPNGWNSWSGSASSGGYGTGIDEDIILENLDVMATELRDWGMDWFQIDDGYEPMYGEWTWREDRFPNGPLWLSEQVRARGLIPGLWMAPFTFDADAPLVAEHPAWFAEKTDLGLFFTGDQVILDLSHPEVRDWLTELGRTVHEDWGYDWYKLDFGYYALFGEGFAAAQTREEAWALGMAALREGLGDDVFLLGVGPMGVNYGRVDSQRTTLDNMPVWEWDPEFEADDHMEQQGFKPTVRTTGRRWYLHNRVWANHPDLLFFRSNPNDPDWPSVTAEESRAFASFVGLSGGIVKLGDRLVDLEPAHINVIRQLLPIYPGAARPLDVLTREFPEQWWLDVHGRDGLDEDYHLVGLFHWGWNVDLSQNPYAEIEDTADARAHTVDLSDLNGPFHAYEFWTGDYLGVVGETLSVSVPSHDARVVALRPVADEPQFLGWNRQISMGGTLVQGVLWDGNALSLEAQVAAPGEGAPFVYELAFFVPDGQSLEQVSASGAVELGDLTLETEPVAPDEDGAGGGVVRVSFVPEGTGDVVIRLE